MEAQAGTGSQGGNGAIPARNGVPGALPYTPGTQNANSSGTSGTQSRLDNASKMDKFRSVLNQLKQNPGEALKQSLDNTGKDIRSLTYKGGAKAVKASAGIAMGLIAAGMTGSGMVGLEVSRKYNGKYTRKIADKMDEKGNEIKDQAKADRDAQMEQNLEDLEEADLIADVNEAYKNYLDWHPNADMDEETEKLYNNVGPLPGTNDSQRDDYIESVQKLNEFYENRDPDTAKDKVLEKISEMKTGKQDIDRGVSRLMDTNSFKNATKGQVDAVAKQYLADMDREGKDYRTSSSYKALEANPEAQRLADNMYNTKKKLEERYKRGNSNNAKVAPDGHKMTPQERANDDIRKMISQSYDKKQNS